MCAAADLSPDPVLTHACVLQLEKQFRPSVMYTTVPAVTPDGVKYLRTIAVPAATASATATTGRMQPAAMGNNSGATPSPASGVPAATASGAPSPASGVAVVAAVAVAVAASAAGPVAHHPVLSRREQLALTRGEQLALLRQPHQARPLAYHVYTQAQAERFKDIINKVADPDFEAKWGYVTL